jgi:hypothetical protein
MPDFAEIASWPETVRVEQKNTAARSARTDCFVIRNLAINALTRLYDEGQKDYVPTHSFDLASKFAMYAARTGKYEHYRKAFPIDYGA